jgi:hypothetical protein
LAAGAWRAAEAEIDPARRQGIENAEYLGDLERRIVRQHDPGAADTDTLRGGRDRRDDDFRRRADDGRMIVMLRHPEAVVAQRFAILRQRHGIADRLVLRAAGDGNGLVEDGKTDHVDLS